MAELPDDEILRRPIGWWLKEADSRLDAAFDSSMGDRGLDRRRWQALATLARSPAPAQGVVSALAPFDEPAAVNAVLDDLRERGWIHESDGLVRLTAEGRREQEALAPLVEGVRRQVAAALPGGDYLTLVRLLARLVAAFPQTSR